MRERVQSFHFPRLNLADFIRFLENEGADPFAAVIFVQENPTFQDVTFRGLAPEPEHNIVIRGTAVFRGAHLAGFLDEGETRGLLWLRNEVQSGQLTLSCPGGPDAFVSADILRSRVRVHPWFREREVGFTVLAQVSSRLTEVGGPLDVADPEVMAMLEAEQAAVVQCEIERAFHRSRELRSDFFGLGETFRRRFPREWRELKDEWREVHLPRVQLEVRVESRIERTGVLFGPHFLRPNQTIYPVDGGKVGAR
jgi:spore germination protein KC